MVPLPFSSSTLPPVETVYVRSQVSDARPDAIPTLKSPFPTLDVAGAGKQRGRHAGRCADRAPRTKAFHGSS